ncbi:dual specificity mitogen-activated protein kinase kinase 4-like isoform X2 [Orbicella faveolata]|nr:dual specificity mitogen-activated protein kinase kinase 4-like isoform X2 [Orbicella faveolata]
MVHEPTGHIMAVKIADLSSENLQKMLVKFLNGPIVYSPHIVPIYGAIMPEEGKVWICMEPMRVSLEELRRRVYATPGRRMPEQVIREIAIAVIHALNNLCTRLEYPHRGVTPSNILVDDEGNFKLCFEPDTYPLELSSSDVNINSHWGVYEPVAIRGMVRYNDIDSEIRRLGRILVRISYNY